MEEFLSDTTIHGVEFFESKDKYVRRGGFFVFFIAFCGLGFFVFDIFVKFKVNPIIVEEVNLVPASDFPFPAVTICNPLFSRDQKPNLYKVLKNPGKKLSSEEQKILAANVQACAPHLGENFAKIYPGINSLNIVDILNEKFYHINDSLVICAFQTNKTSSERLFNYVLTDYGFCFSYNLQGFHQLFNSEVISENFHSYKRSKIAKIYSKASQFFPSYETVDDDRDEVSWTLSQGYFRNFYDIQPTRATILNTIIFYPMLNKSDLNNLCPDQGKTFQLFFHMPNEILTPFHSKEFFRINTMMGANMEIEHFKTDKGLRIYSPLKRGCYFEDEKPLKFFKSYTKALCDFECLTNLTLKSCGCAKFSMPRENSTPICGLNQTSCYLKVWKKYEKISSSCKCLQSCMNIDYKIKYKTQANRFYEPTSVQYTSRNNSLFSAIRVELKDVFAIEYSKISTYSKYNVFADFGSVLGIFFGCSVLSILEIFYFLALKFSKVQSKKIMESSRVEELSDFANESTIHGVQFIFDPSRKIFVRLFWSLAFIIAFGICLFNARGNYITLTTEPEIEKNIEQKLSHDIPLPGITICNYIFAKHNLIKFAPLMGKVKRKQNLNISLEEMKYYYANSHRYFSNFIKQIDEVSNFSSLFDLVEYMDRSQYFIDEALFDCKLGGNSIECSKVFKRVLDSEGFCFTFNQINFHELFHDEISHDFNSFGRDSSEISQWFLDGGYKTSSELAYPYRALENNSLEVSIKIPLEDLPNTYLARTKNFVFMKKSNDFNLINFPHMTDFGSENSFTFSAKVSTYSENFRKFSPENRGCFFGDEKKLKFFKTYTERNCFEECLANETLKTCGCVKFSMPRNDSTPVCIFGTGTICYFRMIQTFPPKSLGSPPCGCLKTCNDIEYFVKDVTKFIPGKPGRKLENFLVSRIKFQFTDTFVEEEQNVIGYDFKDFATDVGGLLGLFLGCSTVSLVEIFFYPLRALLIRFTKKKVMPVEEIEMETDDLDLERFFGERVVHSDLEDEEKS